MKHLIWCDSTFVHYIYDCLINNDKYSNVFAEYFDEYKKYDLMIHAFSPPMDMTDEKQFGLSFSITKNNLPPYKEVEVGDDIIPLLERKSKEVCSLNRKVDVLWSGGIDSTTTLLMLRDYAEKDQLRVIMSEGSIDEYPWLYDTLVKDMDHIVNRDMDFRSEITKENVTVNASMADLMYHGFPVGRKDNKSLGPMNGDFFLCPIEYRVKTYWRLQFMWQQRTFQHLAGYVQDEVIIDGDYVLPAVSLLDDRDVLQWYINKWIRHELPILKEPWENLTDDVINQYRKIWEMLPTEGRMFKNIEESKQIPVINSYKEAKMEFRNYIAKQTGDKHYAYNKEKVSSLIHGQKNMYDNSYPTVAVCDDGSVIRRDQLSSINPFDFVTP